MALPKLTPEQQRLIGALKVKWKLRRGAGEYYLINNHFDDCLDVRIQVVEGLIHSGYIRATAKNKLTFTLSKEGRARKTPPFDLPVT